MRLSLLCLFMKEWAVGKLMDSTVVQLKIYIKYKICNVKSKSTTILKIFMVDDSRTRLLLVPILTIFNSD
jgi:hypothetical protein